MKNNKGIRAIYIGDLRQDCCPVFEFDEERNDYFMLVDKNFRYTKEVVEEDDDDFLIFYVIDDVV